ncbi:oligosaccharide flippase family protein [Bacteroidales bacterium OttesenSCG-928-C19]|nr:oligosaccharide flippase family protein [Bacteroidales bacterium OttesenSCG-928-C19]
MQKKFLSGLFLMLLFNLLIKPFWMLGIEVAVQNRVGAESYGLYFAILNTTFLFNILLDFGITNYNNRYIAQNNQLLSKQLARIVPLKLTLGALFTIVTFFVGFLLGYDSYRFYLLGVLCFNQFLSSFILYLRSNLAGLLMFKVDSVLSVLDRSLMILFCGILLWGNITDKPFQIEWFVYSQTAAYVITALIALLIILRKTGKLKLRFNKVFAISILKQSLPFAVLALLMTFYNRIDSIIIEKILDDGEYYSGVYASSYRLLDAVNMFSYMFSVLLLPIFSRMLKDKQNIQKITKLAFSLMFIVAVPVAISSSFQNTAIIDLLYTDPELVADSSNVFRILILGFMPISFTYIFGTLLTAGGTLKQLNIIAGMGALLNIAFDLIFIPEFKAMGAAWTSLTAQSLTSILQIIYAVYYFKIKVNKSFLLKLVLFAASIILVNIVLKETGVSLFPVFAIVAIISVLLPFVLRIINLKSIIHFIKTEVFNSKAES